jgi:hypothetical protein
VPYASLLALFALLSFLTLAAVMWCVTKPRTRWLLERVFWVLFGILFGVTMLLAILTTYGDR